MNRRSFVGIGALVVGAMMVGCGPPWQVIVQAAPDPFMGQRRFSVLPIDYAGLMIGRKPEPVYLSEKDPKQQASFAEDKAALNERFLETLQGISRETGIDVVPATGPGDAPFQIRPTVSFIEPGFYGGVVSMPSMVHMTVRIVTPDGKVLDEIALAHGTSPGSGVAIGGVSIPAYPASGARLRKDGEELGHIVAKYLKARSGG
jgi:hypothetical protein